VSFDPADSAPSGPTGVSGAGVDILRLCARPKRVGEERERLRRRLAGMGDWGGFGGRAIEEGVAQLAYRALKEHADVVPGPVLEELKRAYLGAAVRYLRLASELRPVVRDLAGRGFRFAFTKGIRLAEPIYGDFALRAFSDIDMVVHEADGAAIEAALEEMGFSGNPVKVGGTDGEPPEAGRAARASMLRTHSPYYLKDKLAIEIHYDLLGLQIAPAAADEIWAGVGAVGLEGAFAIPVMSLEHELCHLCLHLMQHSYSRLIWLADVAEIAGRPDLDWGRVAEICRTEGIGAPVHYGLHLTDRLWPGAVPREPLETLRPGPFQRALCRLFWPEGKVRAREKLMTFPYFLPSFFALLSRRDLGTAVRMVWRAVFPPRAWIAHYHKVEAGTMRGALKLAWHYAWRVQRPFTLVARRLLRLE
jgi:hypothetical protein